MGHLLTKVTKTSLNPGGERHLFTLSAGLTLSNGLSLNLRRLVTVIALPVGRGVIFYTPMSGIA